MLPQNGAHKTRNHWSIPLDHNIMPVMTKATSILIFDGITLKADRVCDDPDGYDRILAWDPETDEQIVEISWHRDTSQLGLT